MPMNLNIQNKKILICPLGWGLGHITRDIYITRHLIKNNNSIIFGTYRNGHNVLKNHFPKIPRINFPSYSIRYSKFGNQIFTVLIQLPKICFFIFYEHSRLKTICRKHNIDIIISDNRYGLWNRNIYSIFITHQIQIQVPFGIKFIQNLINKINSWFIGKYNECWVPDISNEKINLAGELSMNKRNLKNIKYIGILSRFCNTDDQQISVNKSFDILILLSGPEPQRSIFEKKVIRQLKNINYRVLLIQGLVKKTNYLVKKNITIQSTLPDVHLKYYLLNTPYIICRSGYSTIMDLICLKKTAYLVPTPGQTEQEYLAKHLMENKLFPYCNQNEFEINITLDILKNWEINNVNWNNVKVS